MKRQLFVLCFGILFCSAIAFGSKKAKELEGMEFHVADVSGTGDVAIDANNTLIEPKMLFDIYKTTPKIADPNDPNKVWGGVEIPIARILITHTSAKGSTGTIINRIDGSKPQINEISRGMVCRATSKYTLKSEKKIFKNQKKAVKRQNKLIKYEAKGKKYHGKGAVWEAMEKTTQDPNGIDTLKIGGTKVEKK